MSAEAGVKALMREAVGFLRDLARQEKKAEAADNSPWCHEDRVVGMAVVC